MKCKDIMTPEPQLCLPFEPVIKAARIMKEWDCGVVPVVEDMEGRRLVGIVTDRDLSVGVVAAGKIPEEVPVEECMTPDPYFCNAEDDLNGALYLMQKRQVRRVPVVDENGACCGMISLADVAMGVVAPPKMAELIKKISEPAQLQRQRRRKEAA